MCSFVVILFFQIISILNPLASYFVHDTPEAFWIMDIDLVVLRNEKYVQCEGRQTHPTRTAWHNPYIRLDTFQFQSRLYRLCLDATLALRSA